MQVSEIINYLEEKIKVLDYAFFNKTHFLLLIFLFSNLISFVFGISVVEDSKVIIIKKSVKTQYEPEFIIASSTSKKYYYLWCVPPSLKIKNAVFLKSVDEAKKLGYTLSKTCTNTLAK